MAFGLCTSPSGSARPDPCVPADTRVYAVGDIHGCPEKLRVLHRMILGDAADAPERRVVVYVGDYIDRGPDSREAVDLLIEEPLEGFESIHLIGNHEAFLLEFLDSEMGAMPWLMNGGDATCRSYGVDPYVPPDLTDRFSWLRQALAERLPEAHLAFFRGLVPHHVEGDYLFVHAGIRPGVALADQDPADLIWIREPFLGSDEDHGKMVIHGHTPTAVPDLRHNRIGIDTGACFGGPLTALVLEGDSRRFLQV
ncbi:MAG: serine/threonine protein phosphatase [Rhodospirillales bacterium]|nr:serine/threonine protein phosphatase [Rhodospirillales bacterium]